MPGLVAPHDLTTCLTSSSTCLVRLPRGPTRLLEVHCVAAVGALRVDAGRDRRRREGVGWRVEGGLPLAPPARAVGRCRSGARSESAVGSRARRRRAAPLAPSAAASCDSSVTPTIQFYLQWTLATHTDAHCARGLAAQVIPMAVDGSVKSSGPAPRGAHCRIRAAAARRCP